MTVSAARDMQAVRAAEPYQLEMKDVAISGDGVMDFVWPVPVGAHKPMKDAAARTLIHGLRSLTTREPLAREAFFLLTHHLLVEWLTIFNSLLVADGFRRLGRDPLPPARGRVLAPILAGRAPSQPLILNHLRKGPPKPSRLRAPLRALRELTIRDGLTRQRLFGPDYEREIISTVTDELIGAHARHIGERVTFCRPHLWFSARTVEEAGIGDEDCARCCELAVTSFEAGLRAANLPPAAHLSVHFRSWLPDAIRLTAAHLRGLAHCGTPVPKRLWTGSGGNIWSRILRHATRQRGGHVSAYDHGAGAGQFLGEWFKNPIEFDTCDTFVSFTPGQAEDLVNHIAPDFKVRADAPALAGLPAAKVESKLGRTEAKSRPTVMVLSSFYFGDIATHQSFMPDVPFLDWEARLLAKLQQWDFPVLYKPHPLIVTRSPLDIAARFGASELDRPSEEVISQADVLILPDPASTAFATALSSDRPAVFADFGLYRFLPKARTLLEQRCAVVDVPLDHANRPQPDWNALRDAILGAHGRSGFGYVERYYGNVYRH